MSGADGQSTRSRALAVVAATAIAVAATAGCTSAAVKAGPGASACASLVAEPAQGPPPVDPGRPVVGFDPYNTFGTAASQALLAGVVRAMARNGMRAAGYRYVILDDGWQGSRTSAGQITASAARFPCGIARLAAFVHAEGFRFGLYTSPAPRTCSGRPGSGGHVAADTRTFAGWGVDYVKLDWCGSDYSSSGAAAIASTWRAALDATRRPVILAINAGGSPSVGSWARSIADSWRVGGDICGSWYNQTRPPSPAARGCYSRQWEEGVYDYLTSPGLREQALLAGPGHYIDPDMLEVGVPGTSGPGAGLPAYALDSAEARTNFAMWAMWSAPLIAGNDPRIMNGADLASQVLLNRQVLSVDQDALGIPATQVLSGAGWQAWRKPLSGGRAAIAVVNLADTPQATALSWSQLGLAGPPASVSYVWTHQDIPVTPSGLTVQLGAHDTAMYLLAGA